MQLGKQNPSSQRKHWEYQLDWHGRNVLVAHRKKSNSMNT